MDRKPIFDAVRSLLGRGFAQDEVELLDRAIDRAMVCDSDGDEGRSLGALSERFESGGRGAGAVSTGRGDPGGVSYGIWQLSSRAGTAAAFVAGEGARWRDDFGGAPPGSEAFGVAWRAIAARDAAAFAEAQRAFIERTHYRPAVAAVLRETGVDLDARVGAVRDAAWSVAVQHGAAAKILAAAVGAAEPDDDRALIRAIYAERTAYVLRLAARSGAAARRALETVAADRYPAELAAALSMLDARVPQEPCACRTIDAHYSAAERNER